MVKHPLQLEMTHGRLQRAGLGFEVARGRLIPFGFSQLEQLGGIGDAFGGALYLLDRGGQARALPAQLLSPLLIGPDGRVLQLAPDLLEALLLPVVLKETPEGR